MRRLWKVLGMSTFLVGVALLGVALRSSPALAALQNAAPVAKIVYVTYDDKARTQTLSMVDANGENPTVLVHTGFFFNPVWSPDGKFLAFLGKVRDFDKPSIYVMNSDGTHLRKISVESPATHPPNYVAWSPDSTQLIYGAYGPGGIDGFYLLNLDGSGQERLRFDAIAEDFFDTWVAWSPDGSQIAVHAKFNGSIYGQLFVADVDGSNAVAFPATTADGSSYAYLAWSPDGQQVVLNMIPGLGIMGSEALMIANADGSNLRTLVESPPDYKSSVSWSPDGSQLVFVANEPAVDAMPGGELWVVNVDGSNVHALNIAANVANVGTTWGLIPTAPVSPVAPIALASASQ